MTGEVLLKGGRTLDALAVASGVAFDKCQAYICPHVVSAAVPCRFSKDRDTYYWHSSSAKCGGTPSSQSRGAEHD